MTVGEDLIFDLIIVQITKFPLVYHRESFTISGRVRGGSGGSADPPKILETVRKKLKIEHPDPPRSKYRQSDPPM